MPILQYLDIAIGYTFAMLLLATMTGAVVEIIQAIMRSRTFALEQGLTHMIESLGLTAVTAKQLAKEVIADSPVKGQFLAADAVQREEFIMILLRKAAAGSDLKKALDILTGNKDPDQLLRDIEQHMVKAEADDPKAPSYVWRVKAMEAAGAGALAGRVFTWYDNMTRRVEDTVGMQGRVIGLIAAAFVCFWLIPIDSLDLLRRLGRDEVFRKALVERAIEEVKKAPPSPIASPVQDAKVPTAATSEKKDAATAGAQPNDKKATSQEEEANRISTAIKKVQDSADEARGLLKTDKLDPDPWKNLTAGRAITWVMVSLGSAFWWGLLRKLVGLKSSMAEKVEVQRYQRESDQRATTP